MIAFFLAHVAAMSFAITAPVAETKVLGFEYAFRMPSELPAGLRAFQFENRGKMRHELNISLLKQGVTIQQFIAAANASKPMAPYVDSPVGVLFAEPGKSSPSALVTDLRAGRTYAVICIFTDSAGKPRHYKLGMYSAMRVTGAAAPNPEPLRVDTIVGKDYAFRAPATLRAGVHTFAFVNKGKQRHEVSIALLKKGVTLRKIQELDKADGDIEPYLESGLGVLHALGGTSPAGLLRIKLLPGREYLIECGFSDTDKSPPHYKLGMSGSFIAR